MSDGTDTAAACQTYLLTRSQPPQRATPVAVGREAAARSLAALVADLDASLHREDEANNQLGELLTDYNGMAASRDNWRSGLWLSWTVGLFALSCLLPSWWAFAAAVVALGLAGWSLAKGEMR